MEGSEDVSTSHMKASKFNFETCLNISPSSIGNFTTHEWWENCAGPTSSRVQIAHFAFLHKIGDSRHYDETSNTSKPLKNFQFQSILVREQREANTLYKCSTNVRTLQKSSYSSKTAIKLALQIRWAGIFFCDATFVWSWKASIRSRAQREIIKTGL